MDTTEKIKHILDDKEDESIKVKVYYNGLKVLFETKMDEGLRYNMIQEYIRFIISHTK